MTASRVTTTTQRGSESEHRMDELKNGLHMDRLSCHRFMANFFRLLLHTAAFNRSTPGQPAPARVLRVGQPCTQRSMLIKVAAVIVHSAPTHRGSETRSQLAWWTMYNLASETLELLVRPDPSNLQTGNGGKGAVRPRRVFPRSCADTWDKRVYQITDRYEQYGLTCGSPMIPACSNNLRWLSIRATHAARCHRLHGPFAGEQRLRWNRHFNFA